MLTNQYQYALSTLRPHCSIRPCNGGLRMRRIKLHEWRASVWENRAERIRWDLQI